MFTTNSQHFENDVADTVSHVRPCKPFIKVGVLQWTEMDETCGSMFLLEITMFVCSVT